MFRNSRLHATQVIKKLYSKQFQTDTSQRNLFSIAKSTTREYNGRKLIGYSMQQMYDVVSDVANYKYFVPFCKKSTILRQTPRHLEANLVIGFPPLVENYTSHVTLVEPRLVQAICLDGTLFNHLETTWKFSPALKNISQSCIVDFYISFAFRSVLHSHLASLFFDKLVTQMEQAFIDEAKVRFGKEAIKSVRLEPQVKR